MLKPYQAKAPCNSKPLQKKRKLFVCYRGVPYWADGFLISEVPHTPRTHYLLLSFTHYEINTVEEVADLERARLKEEGQSNNTANQYRLEIQKMASKSQLETFLSRILAANSCGVGISAAKPCRDACTEIQNFDFANLETGKRFRVANLYS